MAIRPYFAYQASLIPFSFCRQESFARWIPVCSHSEPPPNYSHDLLPETNFTCSDKATGGYYADPEAGCQMFHVCVRVSDEEIRDFKFLCPNDTVFDQQNFICANWRDIDCKRSTRYYSKNDLFRVDESTTEEEYETESTASVFYEDTFDTGSGGRKGKSQDGDAAQSRTPCPRPRQAAPRPRTRREAPSSPGRLETFLADDHADEDNLFHGVSDPFASYDWRRDSSGVTGVHEDDVREQRFGTGPRCRAPAPLLFSPASRNQEFTSTHRQEQGNPSRARAHHGEGAGRGRVDGPAARAALSSARGASRYSSVGRSARGAPAPPRPTPPAASSPLPLLQDRLEKNAGRRHTTALRPPPRAPGCGPRGSSRPGPPPGTPGTRCSAEGGGARMRSPAPRTSADQSIEACDVRDTTEVMVTECAMKGGALASPWKEEAEMLVIFTVARSRCRTLGLLVFLPREDQGRQ
ncbi:hypothetical protein C7M84_011926 [Penaeus vannamei]|uniref:Chitin-binding type-2 domain-containing protein n=1 Tax=Penaeus vannamei TaxID=6689 RepID=A0A423T034_PENVA|nr:hypothetical protein C7M84_011926 [Penaeus vannamei]